MSPGDLNRSAFGKSNELLSKVPKSKFYDFGSGTKTCLGGTSTLVYDPASEQVELEYLSLAGTIRNCAGGLTPWGSWITCEENTSGPNGSWKNGMVIILKCQLQ